VILVALEHHDGAISRASWEAAAAAQGITPGGPLALLLLGTGVDALAQSAAAAGVGPVHVIDHPALEHYAPDPFVHAIGAAVAQLRPDLVVMAHTYQARDMAPALAARLSAPLVADVIATARQGDDLLFRRPMFQGKLVADVRARPPQGVPTFVTCQVGAFRADNLQRGDAAPVARLDIELPEGINRQSVEPPFREARQSVDLGQAERIVAVGRGIKAQEHLAVAQALADALGAELAASRPICDNGWLPMERQVGSSGQTVAPKLYVALGISGAIQHLVGMKGSRTIVAINKDADAPIFEVADYGIVGDLFDIVPAVTSALTKGTS
jgi:electron transfer flavoprotein alpha subunit